MSLDFYLTLYLDSLRYHFTNMSMNLCRVGTEKYFSYKLGIIPSDNNYL